MWTPNDLAGLSGEREPAGWDVQAEQEEMLLAEKRKAISQKEMYANLVSAIARERMSRIPEPTQQTPSSSEGIPREE